MSVTIITINLSGKYIGADFMSPVKSETINLLLLQLIAKSHEIMVVASLSVVVMDFVRHELIFGGGVPLGLISAGINFNRFWTGWNPWNIKFKSRTPAWDPNSGASTNGRVSFGFEWLNLWAPKAPIKGSDTWGPSTIKNISSNTALLGYAQINITGATSLEGWLNDRELGQKKVAMLEAIIGSVVVDGLSRTGSYQLFKFSDPSCN
ncbi:Tetratricopeptide repeat family protein [Aspergillus niger]|uniref:Tetratricopeptide repeat family protein n=1 Tax=Aspergillus niger TaxID=5061 RepID=A0A505HZH4_ASPNG|nr:Tetratricopeptide repeat family protein [Aspergillus niger]